MKQHLYIIHTLALTLFLFGCSSEKSTDEDNHADTHIENGVVLTQAQYSAADIQLGTLVKRHMGEMVTANGKLDVPPQQIVSISVPISGFVKNTSLLQGTYVRKGQRLAVLENLDYIQIQQDYLDIKSQLEYAKEEYDRQTELAKEQVNAKKTLQQAKANYHSLEARYKGLAGKLRLMHINPATVEQDALSSTISVYAPISGYITEVNVNVGQYVAPQDVLFRIVNTEHLHVELTVFEKDISKLKEEQPVRFTLANESKERTATVHLIGKEITTERTVRVHCHLDSEDETLLPGMFLKAKIETNGTDVFALPEKAIVQYGSKYYVYLVDNKNTTDSLKAFVMKPIEIGNTDQGYTEVTLTSDMNMQTRFVTNGAYALLAKMNNTGEEGHGH